MEQIETTVDSQFIKLYKNVLPPDLCSSIINTYEKLWREQEEQIKNTHFLGSAVDDDSFNQSYNTYHNQFEDTIKINPQTGQYTGIENLPSQGPVDMGATNISATVQNPTAPVSNITESINMTSPFEVTSTAKEASFLKDLKPVDTNMSSVSDVANIGSKTKDVLNVGGKVMGALGTVAGVAEMGSKEFKRKSNQYKSGTAMQTVLGGLSLVPGLQFLSLGSLAAGLLKGKK